MLYFLGGIAILCGLLLLIYLFVRADPARLARVVKWGGIAAVALALLGLLVLTEGRVLIWAMPLAALLPVWRRLWARLGRGGAPAAAGNSTAETPFIRMTLDHDTGRMTGTVLQGRFAGMRLEELRPPELLALLRECRAADEEGARLLEAYLDRVRSNWHDEMASDWGRSETTSAGAPDVNVDEAYAILGLKPGADDEAIKAAHHRLMKQLHPDHGGTDYLATKINRARDVLLHRQGTR